MPANATPNFVETVISLHNFLASEYSDKPEIKRLIDKVCARLVERHFDEVELAIDACKRDFQGRLVALANDLDNGGEDGNC